MKRSGAALKTLRRLSVEKNKRANYFNTRFARGTELTEVCVYSFAGRCRQRKLISPCSLCLCGEVIFLFFLPPATLETRRAQSMYFFH